MQHAQQYMRSASENISQMMCQTLVQVRAAFVSTRVLLQLLLDCFFFLVLCAIFSYSLCVAEAVPIPYAAPFPFLCSRVPWLCYHFSRYSHCFLLYADFFFKC